MPRVLWWSIGGWAFSYERGTPVGHCRNQGCCRNAGVDFESSGEACGLAKVLSLAVRGHMLSIDDSWPECPCFERLTRGTVTSTMRRAANPSGCARCGAGAGCSARKKHSLSMLRTLRALSMKLAEFGQIAINGPALGCRTLGIE